MAMVRIAYMAPLPSMEQLVKQAEAVVQGPRGESVGAMVVPQAGSRQQVAGGRIEVAPPSEVPPWEEPPVESAIAVVGIPADWSGVVALVRQQKAGLAATLGQQVRCVSLTGTELVVQVERGLMDGREVVRELRTVLKEATGRAWMVEQGAGGSVAPTLVEQEKRAEVARKDAAASDPALRDVLAMFPGSEIEQVESLT